MKILIVYGTGEGQTRKIARYMEDVLTKENHQVVIADATEEPPRPDDFDAVLIGASIHIQKYQKAVRHYVMDNVEVLNKRHSAFFSVCMAVASDIREEHEEAHRIAEAFLEKTDWQAKQVKHIAGALRYTQYDYFKRLIMRMIAKKEGGPTDTSQDYEFTDWEDVRKFVIDFANQSRS